jgi:hypothetical protein
MDVLVEGNNWFNNHRVPLGLHRTKPRDLREGYSSVEPRSYKMEFSPRFCNQL